MVELYLHSLICLHGLVLNYLINHRDKFIFYISVKIHILGKEKFCFYYGETTFSYKM
jgi:hypothetical protein